MCIVIIFGLSCANEIKWATFQKSSRSRQFARRYFDLTYADEERKFRIEVYIYDSRDIRLASRLYRTVPRYSERASNRNVRLISSCKRQDIETGNVALVEVCSRSLKYVFYNCRHSYLMIFLVAVLSFPSTFIFNVLYERYYAIL